MPAKTYTVAASVVGKKLTVTVTAVRSGWQSGTATSAAVTVRLGHGHRRRGGRAAGDQAAGDANGKAISGATKAVAS